MTDFLLTLFLGMFGVHRFRQKKYVTGLIWLFTLGLFGFGWAIDTIIALVNLLQGKQPQPAKNGDFFGGGVQPSANMNLRNESRNTPKNFSQAQIKAMTKADILSLGADMGYIMKTTESSTKDKIAEEFLKQQEIHPQNTTSRKWLIKTFNTEIVGTFAKCDLDKTYERSEIICSLKPNSNLELEYWEYKGEPAYYVIHKGLDAGCVPATISKTLHDIYEDCELVVTLRDEPHLIGGDWIQKIKIEVYK